MRQPVVHDLLDGGVVVIGRTRRHHRVEQHPERAVKETARAHVEHGRRIFVVGTLERVLAVAQVVPGGHELVPGLHPDLVEVQPDLRQHIGRWLSLDVGRYDAQGGGSVGFRGEEVLGRKTVGEACRLRYPPVLAQGRVDVEKREELRLCARPSGPSASEFSSEPRSRSKRLQPSWMSSRTTRPRRPP